MASRTSESKLQLELRLVLWLAGAQPEFSSLHNISLVTQRNVALFFVQQITFSLDVVSRSTVTVLLRVPTQHFSGYPEKCRTLLRAVDHLFSRCSPFPSLSRPSLSLILVQVSRSTVLLPTQHFSGYPEKCRTVLRAVDHLFSRCLPFPSLSRLSLSLILVSRSTVLLPTQHFSGYPEKCRTVLRAVDHLFSRCSPFPSPSRPSLSLIPSHSYTYSVLKVELKAELYSFIL